MTGRLKTRLVFLIVLFSLQLCWTGRLGIEGSLSKASEQLFRRDFAGALMTLLEGSEINSEEAGMARLGIALSRKGLGEFPAALRGFQELEGDFQQIGDYLKLWEGECFQGMALSDSTLPRYTELLDTNPESHLADSARVRIARIHLKEGRHRQALKAYKEIVEQNLGGDLLPEALFGLAQAQFKLGRGKVARLSLLKLMESYPKSEWALRSLEVMSRTRSHSDAYLRGRVYFHHKRYDLAIQELEKLLRRRLASKLAGETWYLIGMAYFEKGRYKKAERAFTKVYKDYNSPSALFYKARCKAEEGRNEEAALDYLKLVSQFPHHELVEESLWRAAWAWERNGDLRRAREIYLRLNKEHPQGELADQAGWRAEFALYRLGEYQGALDGFVGLSERAKEGFVRDQSLFWAGKCLQKLNRWKETEEWFRRAAESFPRSYYSARARLELSDQLSAFSDQRREDDEWQIADSGERIEGYLRRAYLLADLGLRRAAEIELKLVERRSPSDLDLLRVLRKGYERIRAPDQALRISIELLNSKAEYGSSLQDLYPGYYWDEVASSARETGLDPHLILAVIRQESLFDADAISVADARGLMQVLPSTGRQLAIEAGMSNFDVEKLYWPEVSIRLGSRFLADQMRRFGGGLSGTGLALAAYNAGPQNVEEWLQRLPRKDPDEFLENIPFKETRMYVKRVLKSYQIYKYLGYG